MLENGEMGTPEQCKIKPKTIYPYFTFNVISAKKYNSDISSTPSVFVLNDRKKNVLNVSILIPLFNTSTDFFKSRLKNNAILPQKSNQYRDLYEPVYLMYILPIWLDE
jgi:hypothetical protein